MIENIRIRPEFFEVYKDDELLELTPKEFELLLYLIERQGRVITREHMLNLYGIMNSQAILELLMFI